MLVVIPFYICLPLGDTETPANIKFYDQEILYSELYTLNINPDLVVLSA
jgi:hypothetical protein